MSIFELFYPKNTPVGTAFGADNQFPKWVLDFKQWYFKNDWFPRRLYLFIYNNLFSYYAMKHFRKGTKEDIER